MNVCAQHPKTPNPCEISQQASLVLRRGLHEDGVLSRLDHFCTHTVRALRLAIPLSTLLLTSCIHNVPTASHTQSPSLLFPAASGARQAHHDILAGRLQLMEAGTRGRFSPNVPADDPRFAKLPRHSLPSGCIVPNATAWLRYAIAQNHMRKEHRLFRLFWPARKIETMLWYLIDPERSPNTALAS